MSKARSLVSTSGEARSLANHAGTSRTCIGFTGFVEEAGVVLGLSPTGAVPFPGREPVPFSETRGAGLAVVVLAAEAKGSVRGDWFFWDEGGSPRLARGPRVGALSDEAGPQPASPARSIRLMSSIRGGQTGCRDGRDKRMPSGLSLLRLLLHCAVYMPFPISIQYPHMGPPRMRGYAEAGGEGGEVQEGGYEFLVLSAEF